MPRFRDTHSLRRRKKESDSIRRKYPDHVPILVEPRSAFDPVLSKTKYLLPKSLTISQLQYVVRRNLSLRPEHAIFLMCNGRLMPSTCTMAEAYECHRDEEDEFLYFTYTLENVFGSGSHQLHFRALNGKIFSIFASLLLLLRWI